MRETATPNFMQPLIKLLPIILTFGQVMVLGLNRTYAAATEPYGLEAMNQFERLPYLKLDTLAGGQSSFDRTGGNADCSNFLYTNGTEKVLLDMTGPGTVYRIWFTGFNPSTDYIKVYFDSESAPRINMLLKDMFSGQNAPFLSPLVGDDTVSSGGFYCYLPMPFNHSIRITSNGTAGAFYYNIGYHRYSPDTTVTTWSGTEDSSKTINLWNNAGADPKSPNGNTTVSNVFDLPAGATQTLLDVPGPRSISSIKLRIPGVEPQPQSSNITDDGRAQKGSSQFQMAVDPANNGVVLMRRLDFGIGNQKANVYVDGALAGQWYDPGSDGTYHWRNSAFTIPPAYTANKSSITLRVSFVSSDNDWNEFTYWAYSQVNGVTNLTDTLDVGNVASESSHGYAITNQTWTGTRTFQYPPPAPPVSVADCLTNLWLRISFDSEAIPSVFAPIGSFFAMGQFASYHTRSLPVGMDDSSNLYCYFPMPFARRATVQLVSQRASVTTNIVWQVSHKAFTDSFTNVGYFKTAFRAETPTTNGTDIGFLDVEGAGHLVGVVESMMGPVNRSFLEGDEHFYVDDSYSPSFSGTGTEDFYNAGWYFNHGLFTRPTHGNPAHLSDASYDYTTAYRLFLADPVTFRKHLRAGIEHGPTDDVAENVWTIAYYYLQSAGRAALADQLRVGDVASETAHAYTISNQTWNGTQTFTYEWQGDFSSLVQTNTGRAHKGYSQFTMSLPPANVGAILRRQFDQGIASQQANVYVDGTLVGPWYRAGGNTWHRWRDDDFMIPATCTSGKSTIQVKVQYVSSTLDWNEFAYSLYALKPAAAPNSRQPHFLNYNWNGPAGDSAFALTLTGSTNANYDIWASASLSDWNWLGAATESAPGQYAFTDTAAGLPCRFYRAVGP